MNELDALVAKFSGLVGAMLSLAYMKGPLVERLTNAVGGAIVSLYSAPWLSQKTGLPESLAGFLMGLFGMAICAKGWELIQTTPIAEVWDGLLKKVGMK